jgi:hypothetical protein
MRVSLSTYGSHGDVEAMVGLAVRLRALGAEMPVRGAGLRGAAGRCRRGASAATSSGSIP